MVGYLCKCGRLSRESREHRLILLRRLLREHRRICCRLPGSLHSSSATLAGRRARCKVEQVGGDIRRLRKVGASFSFSLSSLLQGLFFGLLLQVMLLRSVFAAFLYSRSVFVRIPSRGARRSSRQNKAFVVGCVMQ